MKHFPFALALARLLTGLLLPVLAFCHCPPLLLSVLFLLGFFSDIADGMIARRLGISTLALRRFDSRADLVFLIGSAGAVWFANRGAFLEGLPWICGYALLFALRNSVDFFRYRSSPSYHMWSGKIWALLISAQILLALSGTSPSFLLPLAFAVYLLNAAEGILASLVLPCPRSDIPTFWHALRLSRSPDSLHEVK